MKKSVCVNESLTTLLAPALVDESLDLSELFIDRTGFERLEIIFMVGAGDVDDTKTLEAVVKQADTLEDTPAEIGSYEAALGEDQEAWDRLLDHADDAEKVFRLEVVPTKKYVVLDPVVAEGFDTILGIAVRGVNPLNVPVGAANALDVVDNS